MTSQLPLTEVSLTWSPLLVGAKGSPLELVLSSLYFESDVPPEMRYAEWQRVAQTEMAQAIPLHTRYRTSHGPIVGTTLEYFEFRGLELDKGRLFADYHNYMMQVADLAQQRGALFLVIGVENNIIDTGHVRARDLRLEITGSPLEAMMANEVWEEIYDRLADLIHTHRTTLIFVNTRRLAERAAAALGERLGEEHVTAHHGSLAREHRLDAEQRLKHGKLKALVATASLELGIDIGDVDLVCQLGSTKTISS